MEARLLLLCVWASQNASRQTSGLSCSCGAAQQKFSLSEYNKYIYSMCGLSLTSINVSSFLFFFLNKSEVLENCISGENWVREGLEFKRKWRSGMMSEWVRVYGMVLGDWEILSVEGECDRILPVTLRVICKLFLVYLNCHHCLRWITGPYCHCLRVQGKKTRDRDPINS